MSDKKTHRLVKTPKMSARYLADYMAATERGRRRIVRDCKYRPIARIIQHDRAKNAVSKFILEGQMDCGKLTQAAAKLRNMMADTDFDRDVFDNNADYITTTRAASALLIASTFTQSTPLLRRHGDKTESAAGQCFNCPRPCREQCGSSPRPFATRSIRALKFDLRCYPAYRVSKRCVLLKPRCAGPIRHQRNTVCVLEEFSKPHHFVPLVPERRVHPNKACPFLIQRTGRKPAQRWDMTRPTDRRSDVDVKPLADRIKNVRGRIPLISLARRFICRHPMLSFMTFAFPNLRRERPGCVATARHTQSRGYRLALRSG